ncbi:MAG: hypothetical protein ACKVOQ_09465 [Cyclobacteriaceae bacterium]
MATTLKKAAKKIISKRSVAANSKVKDFSKDSFFERKTKEMELLIKKHGLPTLSAK